MPTPKSSRLRIVLRILAALVLLLLLITAGAAAWFFTATRASFPQLDGTVTLSGLAAPVTVIRDSHGVPHLTADSLPDLFFAQGFITAQDRLWQMDMARRYAAGEIAEVLGADYLRHDRTQRYLQLRWAADNAVGSLSPQDREFLDAYARGVNAYIEEYRDKLPIEFRVLRYQPRPWQTRDSLLIGIFMAQLLNTQYDVELARERIANKLTPELAAELFPTTSWRDRPPAATIPPLEEELNRPGVPLSSSVQEMPLPELTSPACDECRAGSNNWAVAGSRTASGKPLLANDMHLPHQVPGIWYEAHLRSGTYNVAGVTIPGIPFVIAGRNERIAWGFTNLGPDVQDLFIEEFNAAGEYRTPGGWTKPELRREVIAVKDEADQTIQVTVTRHGPVITPSLHGSRPADFPDEKRQLALQWTIYDPAGVSIPFFEINSATNWTEFRAALGKFGGPSQNVVYADVDGHIGYQATGRIPVRASGTGIAPVPGGDGKGDWTGYVPFESLPSVFDPQSGILATANSRITPNGYAHTLATQWFSPYRTERIYKVLQSKQKLTPQDMLALQTDIYSEYDRYLANQFVYAIDRQPNAPARVKQAADLMRNWDGQVRQDAVAPTIVFYARRHLWRLLLEPKVGGDYRRYTWGYGAVALESILQKRPARWLPSQFKSYDELLAAAVDKALADKEVDAPSDLSKWQWGKRFAVDVNHPIFGAIPILKRWAGPGVQPQSGGGYTVKQVGRRFGPSQRLTVDFSAMDSSYLNIVLGQSGNILSPHYQDHWKAWYQGELMPLPFSDAAVQAIRKHELRLVPR